MKYSAIKDLYYGERGDSELVEPSEKMRELFQRVNEQREGLEKLLENFQDIKIAFLNFLDTQEELRLTAMHDYYAEGFRFGVLLGLDVADI